MKKPISCFFNTFDTLFCRFLYTASNGILVDNINGLKVEALQSVMLGFFFVCLVRILFIENFTVPCKVIMKLSTLSVNNAYTECPLL